jgi:Carboxypeptidase regulatory-like domain/TonB-dependent Receptor Plug Domain
MRNLLAVLLLLVSTSPVFAQSLTATLQGTVHDSSGAVVSGATVVVTNLEKGDSRKVVTNSTGDYVVPQLPPQTYSVTVSAPSFGSVINDHLVLEVNQEARFNAVLPPAGTSDKVEVTAGATLIQSEDALNGSVIDQKTIDALPNNSRNFWQLAQLDPNVSQTTTSSSQLTRGGFVVAGFGDTNNNYLLDGSDDNDYTTSQPTVRPSQEAIREFRIITGLAPAEYGRRAGGQIVLSTRSGSNDFHGSAFAFYRNGHLNALPYFNTSYTPYQSKQLGGSIGGRFFRDKSFFFGSYEGTFTAFAPGVGLVFPNSAYVNIAKTGDFSPILNGGTLTNPVTGAKFTSVNPASFSQVSLALLQYFPTPQNQSAPNGQSNFVNNVLNTSNNHQVTFRVDQNLSDKQHIAGEYSILIGKDTGTSGDFVGATTTPNFGVNGPHTYQHTSFSDDYIFTPHLLNEFRAGFNRMDAGYINQDQKYGNVVGALGLPQGGNNGMEAPTGGNLGVPYVSISGFGTIGTNNDPQWRGDNTVHIYDALTWAKGNHNLKVGVDYFNFFKHSFFVSTGRGSFSFNGTTYTGNAWADYLLGYIASDSFGTGNEQQFPRQRAWAGYAEDQWKASPSLTLTYGLRYEYFAPHTEGYNRIAKFDPVQNAVLTGAGQTYTLNNATGLVVQSGANAPFTTLYDKTPLDLAPRFGFAYRIDGQSDTVIRGGYGIYYNLPAIQTWNGATALGTPFLLSKAYTGSLPAPLTWSNPFGSTQPVGGVGVTTINQRMPRSYASTYGLGIQHQFPHATLVELSYQGSQGTHFVGTNNINNPTLATRIANPKATIQSLRPYNTIGSESQWGAITQIEPGVSSNYNSLIIRVQKQYTNGLNFQSYLTYAKSLDNSNTPQNPTNPAAEWGPSSYDQKLRFVTYGSYDLPWGPGRPWLNERRSIPGAIVGSWQASAVVMLSGGRPFTLTTTDSIASNTGGTTDRAFVVPGVDPNAAVDTTGKPTRTVNNWFNSGAFTASAPGYTAANPVYAYGTASYDSLRGPGLQDIDFGLSRRVRLWSETSDLQFRAEAFNLFNHPNFANPASSYSSPSTLGHITSTVGSNLATATGSNRQLQFALRLGF